MRIVHLNTQDSFGAGRAVRRIHAGLLALGEDSSLIVSQKTSMDPTVTSFEPDRRSIARLRRLRRQRMITRDADRYLRDRPSGFEWFSDDRGALGSELIRRLPEADIITLNWIADFVDLRSFFREQLPATKVVWRLSDMNPFTGGCHVDAGCGRFTDSCGRCPQLSSPGANDLSRQIWQRKHEAYTRARSDGLHVVALSTSQAEDVRRSSLLGSFPLTVIPCAVDVNVFFPRSRADVRKCLGLPAKEPIVMMAAQSFGRRNKGAELLRDALALWHGEGRPLIVCVGEGNPEIPAEFEHVHWGSVGDDRLLALLYGAADLLAFPSLQEGFGQTIVEALACGLPVVGFDTGGMRDAVRQGVTGFIAPVKTSEALAEVLQAALTDVDRLRDMSDACRETAATRFSLESVARRYQELYRAVLAGRDP